VSVFFILFEKSRIGKEGVIIGANPEFAIQSGINIRLVKIRAFLMMGTISGLVAFFALIHSATASISTGTGFEVNTLNAMLLGGMAITGGVGSRFRTAIIGTLTMVILLTGMNMMRFDARSQQVIEGLVYLVAVSITFNRKSVAVVK
jgi:ribose transport system permease protein